MHKITRGLISGFIASGPMTYAQIGLFKLLPDIMKSPLPPATITDEIFKKLNISLTNNALIPVTLASHFAYGTLVGAPYSALNSETKSPRIMTGATYGLSVWLGSYGPLHRALGLRSQIYNMPLKRNAMMALSHIVWGVSLAYADYLLSSEADQMLIGNHSSRLGE